MLFDLRSAVRALWRRPFYPILAATVLAIGLSASIAVFTYVNGFYQPFPGVDDNRLVRIFGVENEDFYQDLSFLDFEDYATADGAFEGIAAAQANYAASVRLETMTEVAFLEAVTGDYFSVLGLNLELGRAITADDDRHGAPAVAILSHDWWQRSFNSDRSVIGQVLYLNYRPFTVVGVMAPQFVGATADFRPDVWIPIAPFRDRYVSWTRMAEDRDIPLVRVYARLKPEAGEEAAHSELQAMAAGLDQAHPGRQERRRVRLDRATWIDPRARLAELPTVRLMIGAAAGLLLLVCANVANLLLSVSLGRQKETSVRAALGASRSRLLRQALFESTILSAIAGGVALLVSGPFSVRLGSYFARPSVWGENVAREIQVDPLVFVFAFSISILTGALIGLLPALRASRRDIVVTLKADSSSGSIGIPRNLLGRKLPGALDLLVSAQVALSVTLLVVAGLVLRTLLVTGGLDPGFRFDNLLVTHISTSSTDLKPEERERFFREIAEAAAREPWVQSATVADYPPLSPHPKAELHIEGHTDAVSLLYSKVIPGFFEALGIETRQGRSFTEADSAEGHDVAMINQKLAGLYFGDGSPLGRRLRWPDMNGEERTFEIVGVVADARFKDLLAEPEPMVYFSYPQHRYPTGSALIIATRDSPASNVSRFYRWLRDYEAHLAIVNVVPFSEVVRGYLYTQRMNAELFSVLAVLGLGLATVGIFSVGNLAVQRRTREIGVRMSIGATTGDISKLIVGNVLTPVSLGLLVGLAATLGVTELVRSLLFGVEPTDPLTLAGGAIVLVLAGLAAALLPAHRAATVDPVDALRSE